MKLAVAAVALVACKSEPPPTAADGDALPPALAAWIPATRRPRSRKGLVQYDKVTVKGTVDESFGQAALAHCTIAKAP